MQGENRPGPLVGIVMGSDSDLPVVKGAAEALSLLQIPFEIRIISAHRSPAQALEYARTAAERGLKVLIAAAGGAAHLPGLLAALTPLPVIGIPVAAGTLGGLDALLSIVQMPRGIPVATVAVNGAFNAGILAAQIIGAGDPEVQKRVAAYKERLAAEVGEKDARLQSSGIEGYDKR
ncbi:phosphoribosylaminoimidazole carboxylase, catalytic subunit [Ammonifex degensii KC4]|uniref:N5-carboxyaminoimidazole ribonucleotide mutase n=2 Tax=Ammonifex degensii TaxID=42838 RepID=C9RB42_AMMDK|nr:phosphoribosylaminoimidazole carboxylase, catalytic subunit [Ammonifex degensii KC4]